MTTPVSLSETLHGRLLSVLSTPGAIDYGRLALLLGLPLRHTLGGRLETISQVTAVVYGSNITPGSADHSAR